jgi:hypothetical protein
MKTLKTLVLLLLCLSTVTAYSQKTSIKPTLFSKYPESIQLSKNILQNTLNANEGEEVVISFSGDFRFKGIVLSNIKKYDNLQSVIIRSAFFGNAVLQVTRITNEDKTVSYTGRIINPNAADGYQIKKDKNDNYSFEKFETNTILQDCSY